MLKLDWTTYDIKYDYINNVAVGLDELRLVYERYVYIIELPTHLAIRYPKGISNICYIGRQSARKSSHITRVYGHAKGWIAKYLILTQSDASFSIHVCHPRVRGKADAYRDVEAFLINEFDEKFGRTPLFNKNRGRETGSYEIDINSPIFRRKPGNTKFSIDRLVSLDYDILESDEN